MSMFDLKSLVRNFKEKIGAPLAPEPLIDERAAEQLMERLLIEEMFEHDLADTPFLASLPEKYLRREEHSYSPVRTFLNNRGFSSDNLSEEIAQRFDVLYRVSVSGLDVIPGYRRVVLLGEGFCEGKHLALITVNGQGRVDTYKIPRSLNKASMGVMLENRTDDPGELLVNLNPRSSAAYELCRYGPSFNENNEGKKKALSMFSGMRKSKLRKDMNIALWAVRESMDPEALRIMRSTHMTHISAAAWLTGGQCNLNTEKNERVRCHEDHLSRYRKQAVRAYPLLAKEIMAWSNQVDQGEPLAPLIEQKFYLDAKKVKMLNGLTWQKARCSPLKPHDTILMIKDAKAVPTTKAHFATLSWAKWASTELGKEWSTWALPSKDAWRLTPHLHRLEPNALKDMIYDLTKRIYLPTLMRNMNAKKNPLNEARSAHFLLAERILGMEKLCARHLLSLNPSELADNVERWHRNLGTYNDELDLAAPKISWTGFLGTVPVGKVHARELLSVSELKSQGAAENHCVGGYLNSVLGQSWRGGHSLIFSLEKDDKVLSTIEIQVIAREEQGKAVFEVHIQQNHAKRNTAPTKEAQKAGEALAGQIRKSLNKEKWSAYLTGIEGAQRISQEADNLSPTAKHIGYDPSDDVAFARAWELMSNLLPRKVRKAGPDGMTADIREFLSTFNFDDCGFFDPRDFERIRNERMAPDEERVAPF